MVLCARYGHEIVALANLLPQHIDCDDIDSYMYQTVAHQVIPAYSQCMGLPLFRRHILGSSRDQQLVYNDTPGDEVEDLAALLGFIKTRIPDVQAVSTGAIASDYQRTRVERVCARLGLVSLTYLWHQPQTFLLQRMIDAGISAIIVKVAAAGLHPNQHLGQSLVHLQPQLLKLRDLYGCNVCGEGGEYETLTLDCPLFTHGRIVLDSFDRVMVSDDSMAPVALIHPTIFHVEPKDGSCLSPDVVIVPKDFSPPEDEALTSEDPGENSTSLYVSVYKLDGQSWIKLTAEVGIDGGGDGGELTASDTACMLELALRRILEQLPESKLKIEDALFVHLYIPCMSHFAAANAVYARFLPSMNPPARACIQLGSRRPKLIVEILFGDRKQKKVLHVQSTSEWAPSCIGPYSQAVAHRGLVFFAGHIPLDPATMAVISGDARAQTARALRSCQAVAVGMRTDLVHAALWFMVYTSPALSPDEIENVSETMNGFMNGDSEPAVSKPAENEAVDKCDNDPLEGSPALDGYLVPPAMQRHWDPVMTFIAVDALPRGVVVEIEPVAWSHHGALTAVEGNEEGYNLDTSPRWIRSLAVQQRTIPSNTNGVRVLITSIVSSGCLLRAMAFIQVGEHADGLHEGAQCALNALSNDLSTAQLPIGSIVCAKVYVPHRTQSAVALNDLRQFFSVAFGTEVTEVPISGIGSDASLDADLAFELMALGGRLRSNRIS